MGVRNEISNLNITEEAVIDKHQSKDQISIIGSFRMQFKYLGKIQNDFNLNTNRMKTGKCIPIRNCSI